MSTGEDGDISGRYPLPRIGVPGGAAAEERELQEAALASLGRRPGRLPGLSCFEDMLRSPADALADGPVIGVFCNFFPEELIEAAGGVPVRLCTASVVAESVSEQVLPRDVCPIARASFGAVAGGLGVASKAQAVVVPTACDAKRRLGEMLLDYVPVVTLSIPPRKDHRSELSYWVPELERVARRLSRVTGTAVTRARLREAILHRRTVQDAFHDLENARRDHPHVLAGSDLALVVATSFAANWEAWGQATRRLAEQVRAAGPAHPQPDGFLPLVMTGAPILWPAWKLYHVIEDAGASVVTDTLCSVTQRLCDPVQVDDWSRSGMMRAHRRGVVS